MPRYYVRLGTAGVYDSPPGHLGTALTYQGQTVYALQSSGALVAHSRYGEFWASDSDLDYEEYRVIALYDTRPQGFNESFVDGAVNLRLGWGVIDSPVPLTTFDPGEDGGTGGGGGGVTPPPEPEAPAPYYMDRWSDHWTDAQGIVHYYPQSNGGWSRLYPVMYQETLAALTEVLAGFNGGAADPGLFQRLARAVGIPSSADGLALAAARQTAAQAALPGLFDAGMEVADALTRTTSSGAFTGSYMTEVTAFWQAQTEARQVFRAMMQADRVFADLPADQQAGLVRMLTSQKILVSNTYNREDLADRGYFIGLEASPARLEVTDPLASVIGSIGADDIVAEQRISAVLGAGNDRLVQFGGNSGAVVFAGAGDDRISLYAASTPDRTSHVEGGTGRDMLDGSRFDDKLLGQAGHDTLRGKDGRDTLEGGSGHDKLQGFQGDDTLRGNAGRDTLMGGTGDDLLQGGYGADRLNGWQGDDTLQGGPGRDTFIFTTRDDAHDVIRNFQDGSDRIVIDRDLARNFAALEVERLSPRTWHLTFGEQEITVTGTRPLTLTAADFQFPDL